MFKLKTIEEAIDFAIEMETIAEETYYSAAELIKNKKAYTGESIFAEKFAAKMFMILSDAETQHKNKLKDIKAFITKDKLQMPFEEPFTFEIPPVEEKLILEKTYEFEKIIEFAVKQEVGAYKLYSFLAKESDEDRYRDLNKFFKDLAAEEAEHRMMISVGLED